MKKIFIVMITVGLLMLPLMVFAQSEQQATGTPPVAQPLIREGDFAVKLVNVLKIGTAKNEVEAETMLGSSGISPKNGWIADYQLRPSSSVNCRVPSVMRPIPEGYLWAKRKL